MLGLSGFLSVAGLGWKEAYRQVYRFSVSALQFLLVLFHGSTGSDVEVVSVSTCA